jgi:uncharacterized protein
MTRLCRFLLVAVLFAAPAASALADPAPAPPGPTELLTIVTASGAHRFAVEVMRTDAQRELGLMYRRSLAQDHGMLFAFATVQPVMMWMKNTYIPLDMIFMDKTGHVASIVANATPLSEQILTSGVPVYAVLEVNAGTAAKIGLKLGDSVQSELFGN